MNAAEPERNTWGLHRGTRPIKPPIFDAELTDRQSTKVNASNEKHDQPTECVGSITLQETSFQTPTEIQGRELPEGQLGPVGWVLLFFGALPLAAFPGFLFARAMSRRYFEPLDSPLDLVGLIFVDMTVLYPAVYAICVLGVLMLRRRIGRKHMFAFLGVPLIYCGVAAILFFVLIATGYVNT